MRAVSRRLVVWLFAATVAAALAAPPAAPPAASPTSNRPRAWMGVSLETPEPVSVVVDGETVERAVPGVLVAGVVREGPADKAGLRGGDIVTRINGEVVDEPSTLIAAISKLTDGDWADLDVERRGKAKTVQIRLGSRPERENGWNFRRGWIGIEAVDVPKQLRVYWGGSEDEGVMIGELTESGPAESAGLKPGDLILRVNERPVADADDLAQRIFRAGVGNDATLLVSRQGNIFDLDVAVEDYPEREQQGH